MATNKLATRFKTQFQKLVGRQLSQVFCGPSTGTVLSIDFSPLVPRAHALTNPKLSETQRTREGEFRLYIECVWRLQDREGVISASGMRDGASKYLSDLENALRGRTVVRIIGPEPPSHDVTIELRGVE